MPLWVWRAGLERLKDVAALPEEWGSIPSTSMVARVISGPVALTPSPGFYGYCTHVTYPHKTIHIHKKNYSATVAIIPLPAENSTEWWVTDLSSVAGLWSPSRGSTTYWYHVIWSKPLSPGWYQWTNISPRSTKGVCMLHSMVALSLYSQKGTW